MRLEPSLGSLQIQSSKSRPAASANHDRGAIAKPAKCLEGESTAGPKQMLQEALMEVYDQRDNSLLAGGVLIGR
jgi:hypothetical protein